MIEVMNKMKVRADQIVISKNKISYMRKGKEVAYETISNVDTAKGDTLTLTGLKVKLKFNVTNY